VGGGGGRGGGADAVSRAVRSAKHHRAIVATKAVKTLARAVGAARAASAAVVRAEDAPAVVPPEAIDADARAIDAPPEWRVAIDSALLFAEQAARRRRVSGVAPADTVETRAVWATRPPAASASSPLSERAVGSGHTRDEFAMGAAPAGLTNATARGVTASVSAARG
jgi:hypothetical protein